jgi:hypothetical protein
MYSHLGYKKINPGTFLTSMRTFLPQAAKSFLKNLHHPVYTATKTATAIFDLLKNSTVNKISNTN